MLLINGSEEIINLCIKSAFGNYYIFGLIARL